MLGTLLDSEIDATLRAGLVGHLGVHDEGRTYVVPLTYVYDGSSVYAHSAEGMKLRMLRHSPHDVCFQTDQLEDNQNWLSVIAWGEFEELDGLPSIGAMQLLIDRFSAATVSETASASHLAPRMTQHDGGPQPDLPTHGADIPGRTAIVFRIVLTERTGRYERR